MNQSKIIPKDIPKRVQQDVGRAIIGYSTSIVGLKTLNKEIPPIPLGSATFVQYGENKGLLTAQHVIEKSGYLKCEGIGLAISSGEHKFSIPRQYLQVQLSGPACVEYGPDMAFIKIPEVSLGRIEVQKTFWQMDANCKKIPEVLTRRNYGFWVLFGCPSAYQRTEPGETHFTKVLNLGGLMGASGKPNFVARNAHDYFDVAVIYEDDNDLPKTFKGVSGGGLWFVSFTKNDLDPEIIQVGHPYLMGVAFYEIYVKDNRRVLRCHGPKSIYVKMQNILKAMK